MSVSKENDALEEGRSESEENATASSEDGRSSWTEAMREMGPYLDLGWRLAATTAGIPLLGHFCIDLWFGTTPWGLLGGALIGFVAAGVQLKQLQRELSG